MSGGDRAIREQLDDLDNTRWDTKGQQIRIGDMFPEATAAVRAVLEEHPERRVPISATSSYSICETCCCDSDGCQTSDCELNHTHLVGDWRCLTVQAIGDALRVEVSS